MRFMRTRAGQSVLAATIGASVLVGGVANAAGLIPGPDGVIHACYRTDGRLRVIGVGLSCERNETALAWNQHGPGQVVARTADGTVANGTTASATAECQPNETTTGGGAQIASASGIGGTAGPGNLGGNGGNAGLPGGNGGTPGPGNFANTGFANTGASNTGVLNSGPAATTGGAGGLAAAFLTGSAPSITQGKVTGWTGTVTNLSGSEQSFTVWALCAS